MVVEQGLSHDLLQTLPFSPLHPAWMAGGYTADDLQAGVQGEVEGPDVVGQGRDWCTPLTSLGPSELGGGAGGQLCRHTESFLNVTEHLVPYTGQLSMPFSACYSGFDPSWLLSSAEVERRCQT